MTAIKQLSQSLSALRRPIYALTAIAIGLSASSGVVYAGAAGGQVQHREIRMSDNGASGGSITTGVGSGTNVTYRVKFRAASSYTLKGVVVDFCKGSGGTPFIGDSNCPLPTNFSVGATPTVDTTNYTINGALDSTGIGSGWTATSTGSGQTLVLTNTTGTALTAGTDYTFAISGVTNPSDLGTFYGRLITYTSATGDVANYSHGNAGNYQDYGGFALSTAQVVQVTAKVQENITFCVSGYSSSAYTTAYNTYLGNNPGDTTGATAAAIAATTNSAPSSCTDTTAPAIILGHGNNMTLDTSAVDTANVWTIASTNALNGVTIRMHNSNACGGLSTDSGTTCLIPAMGSATPAAIAAGTANFGMFCSNVSGGTGTLGCDAAYNDGTHTTSPTYYGMDSTSVDDNVTTTYGDTVAASTAPINSKTNQYQFAATASNTTPAGIYRANLAMIATGSF